MSFRKEQKFRLSNYEIIHLKQNFALNGMKRLHEPRQIFSQYFDTFDYQMYHESDEGILPRKKVRCRWYNNTFKKISFEVKTSSVEGRFKTSRDIKVSDYKNFLMTGINTQQYGKVYPSAKISYFREYFLWKSIRITFDTNICYEFFKSNKIIKEYDNVIEIKAPIDCPEDYLAKVFPIPNSRFSKYTRAILSHQKN
jgi:hypothetical protein